MIMLMTTEKKSEMLRMLYYDSAAQCTWNDGLLRHMEEFKIGANLFHWLM